MKNAGAPRLVLISGLPGAGKSALARRFEAEIPAIRLSGDEWMVALGFDIQDEQARDRIEARNGDAMWNRAPISRDQLEGWDRYFEVPDSDEIDLFDPQ